MLNTFARSRRTSTKRPNLKIKREISQEPREILFPTRIISPLPTIATSISIYGR